MRRLWLAMGLFLLGAGAARADAPADLVKRGEYLTRAADCASCHTGPDGREFVGGYKFTLPFGTLYAPNITPDKQTGIGDYTDEEFVAALQRGVGHGGKHLYPVMPYTAYTLMGRDDVLAIKAYLFSLQPVQAVPPPNAMRFPFDQRWLMVFWNLLNNPDHRFQPDTTRPADWNRGAYLVEALGHCQQCHTPRNFMQALNTGQPFAGAVAQDWVAYNLTSDKESGIGAWSDQDLATFLSTGHAQGHGSASGPMAEAVDHSLRYLNPDDIHAMVVYLRGIPAIHDAPPPSQPPVADALGARVFQDACASCHRPDGAGRETPYAALAGSHSTRDPHGGNLLQVVLHGGRIATGGATAFMPSFSGAYTDEELTAVANWTIGHFGSQSGQVTRQDVAKVRPSNAAPSAQRAAPGS
ncbi:MAG: cytochrome c [Acetobacteraceae bacterium]|nr:cytochrome c [Acetobacteraceae bacterium]